MLVRQEALCHQAKSPATDLALNLVVEKNLRPIQMKQLVPGMKPELQKSLMLGMAC